MKLYISADIEGTAGITHWDETDYDRGGRWYDYFREAMGQEVKAAVEGAQAAGADDIVVKDAHDSARNFLPTILPRGVRIHRGWSGNPLWMVTGLDGSFDALAMTGYHSASGSCGNPLAHSMATNIDELLINGLRTSEFVINAYTAGYYGVAVPFLSGDIELCESAHEFLPGITTAAVSEGQGNGSLSLHPQDARDAIRDGIKAALSKDLSDCMVKLPETFDIRVRYKNHPNAYRNSFYPSAAYLNEQTVGFKTDNWFEVIRFFNFVL